MMCGVFGLVCAARKIWGDCVVRIAAAAKPFVTLFCRTLIFVKTHNM